MPKLEQGNILRLIYTDVDPEKEDEFRLWYDTEHEPLLNKVDGVIYNYKALNLSEKGQRYFFMYVHRDTDVQKSTEYGAVSQTKWSRKIRPFLKNFNAEVYQAVPGMPIPTKPLGGHTIRTVRFDLNPDLDAEFDQWFVKTYLPGINKISGVVGVCRALSLRKEGPKHLITYFVTKPGIEAMLDFEPASPKSSLGETLRKTSLTFNHYGIRIRLADRRPYSF